MTRDEITIIEMGYRIYQLPGRLQHRSSPTPPFTMNPIVLKLLLLGLSLPWAQGLTSPALLQEGRQRQQYQQQVQHSQQRISYRLVQTRHFASAGPSQIILPENEFSRPLQTERVLRIRRDFTMNLEATPEECQALALRFDLSHIGKLKAALSLRQESVGGARTGTDGVEVEGTVFASVTQKCVRTNEDFQVDLEFPLYCIVRPVMPIAALLQSAQSESESISARKDRSQAPNNKPRKTTYRPQDRNIREMDILELQRMLQQDITDEDDVLMEDESIYPTDGALDVGELVSQLFWLKLDPYPKKPGTDPVSATITG